MLRTCLACLALTAAVAAPAQTTDLQQLFAGKDLPHSLKLKDLNADWRHVTIASAEASSGGGDMLKQLMQIGMMSNGGKGAGDAGGAMAAMSLLGGMFGGGGDRAPIYYTQGKTTAIAGETFLVAYRLDVKSPNLMELIAQSQKEGGKEPDFAKIAAESKPTPDSPVVLSLVNVRGIGTLSDIRPFDLNREIEEAGKSGGGLMDLLASRVAASPVPAAQEAHAEKADAADEAADAVKDAQSTISSDVLVGAKGNKVEVSNADGKVVLKGTVTSARLKTRAENLVRNTLKMYGLSLPISNQIVVTGEK